MLVFIVLGLITAMSLWYSEKQKAELKAEAELFRRAGKKVYKDKYGVQRSTKTMEEVKAMYGSSFHRYHSVLVGKQTGRVYEDLTEKKIQQINDELKAKGRKYIFKGGTYLTEGVRPTYFQYDPERGKYLRCYRGGLRSPQTFYVVTFGDYVGGKFVADETIPRLHLKGCEQGHDWYWNDDSCKTM